MCNEFKIHTDLKPYNDYELVPCDDYFAKPEWYELGKMNEHWIQYNLNPMLRHLSEKYKQLSYLKSYDLVPKMIEQLLYNTMMGRHCDTKHVSLLGLNTPTNGLVGINHNFINATIDGRTVTRTNTLSKDFCIDTEADQGWDCRYGMENNSHFEIKDEEGDVVIMEPDAVKFRAHKPERTNRGLTSNTLFRVE